MATSAASKLTAKCRTSSGATAELDVLDLSPGGCMVARRAWSPAIGDRVLVTLPGLASQPGQLVWIEDDNAGIAFENALHEAVLTHLEQMLAQN